MLPHVNLPEDFKETEIGPIPVDWEVVSLSQAAEHKKVTLNPQSHPAEMFDYYSIPAYQVSDKSALEHGSEIRSQKLVVESGMVLFGKLNPRVPKIWPVISTSARRKIASTEFIPLVPIDGRTTSEFLYYLAWSDHVLPKSRELVSGSTPSRQRVDVKAFLRIPIPLPPLPEQHRIAHVLSTIQRAIAAQDDLIATARELKRSLMQRLFTYGPGVEPAPTKETEIGEVPEHWELVQLKDAVEGKDGIKRGPWGGSIRKDMFVSAGYKIYEQENVIARDFSLGSYYIDERKFRELEGFSVKSGDVLLTAAGTIGRVAVVPENVPDGIINQALIRIRPREALVSTPYFVHLFDHYREHRIWQGVSHGAVLKNLSSVRVLKGLPIPLPHLSEQQEIVRILSAADHKIESEEQRKAALLALFKTMLHHLMTGQVRLRDVEFEG